MSGARVTGGIWSVLGLCFFPTGPAVLVLQSFRKRGDQWIAGARPLLGQGHSVQRVLGLSPTATHRSLSSLHRP